MSKTAFNVIGQKVYRNAPKYMCEARLRCIAWAGCVHVCYPRLVKSFSGVWDMRSDRVSWASC